MLSLLTLMLTLCLQVLHWGQATHWPEDGADEAVLEPGGGQARDAAGESHGDGQVAPLLCAAGHDGESVQASLRSQPRLLRHPAQPLLLLPPQRGPEDDGGWSPGGVIQIIFYLSKYLLNNFQAQINSDRELQASLRAQGWGCQETDQEMLPRQKRDLEEDTGTQQQGNNVRVWGDISEQCSDIQNILIWG